MGFLKENFIAQDLVNSTFISYGHMNYLVFKSLQKEAKSTVILTYMTPYLSLQDWEWEALKHSGKFLFVPYCLTNLVGVTIAYPRYSPCFQLKWHSFLIRARTKILNISFETRDIKESIQLVTMLPLFPITYCKWQIKF